MDVAQKQVHIEALGYIFAKEMTDSRADNCLIYIQRVGVNLLSFAHQQS